MSEDELRIQAEKQLSQQLSGEPLRSAVQLVPANDPEALSVHLRTQQHELQVHQIELEMQNQELKRTNSALAAAQREFQDLFDNAPVGYLVLDAGGFIQRANHTASRQLGMPARALQSRRFSAFISASDARSFALFLRRTLEQGTGIPLEVSLSGVDSAVAAVQLEGQALLDQDGVPTHCRVTLTDITAQRLAQAEVLRLNVSLEARVEERTARLSALNEELETLMYAVSHDLLTPVRQARDFGQRMTSPGENTTHETQSHYQEKLVEAMAQMESMLQGLLEYCGSGQQRLRFQQIDLNRVVAQVCKAAESQVTGQATGRQVRFHVDPLPTVYGDSLALQLIFSTLVGNALKFTRNVETARVRVSCREEADEFVLCVEDNGVGFNMRQKGRLFGMFQRLHSSRDFEGIGVGLALTKRFVQRHGGRVWATGKPNEGASFWFSLPRVPQPVYLER